MSRLTNIAARVTGNPDERMTWADFMFWAGSLPGQQMGPPCPLVCSDVVYEEFSTCTICRDEPFDIELATSFVASQLQQEMRILCEDFKRDGASVYWRVRPELSVFKPAVIVEYDPHGPDMDKVNDRRCRYDHRFVAVKTYCRMAYTTKEPVWPPEIKHHAPKALELVN